MPFVAFDDIGQRRQLGLFWVAFDAARQRVGAVQEQAVHFVRHFRKARYLPRYDVEPHSKLLCKIAHDAKRVVRGDAFPSMAKRHTTVHIPHA